MADSEAMDRWKQRMQKREDKQAEEDAAAEAKSSLNLLAAVIALKGTGRFEGGGQARYVSGLRQMAGVDVFRKDMWAALATEAEETTEEDWTSLMETAASVR